ncbi:hypothetical protein HYR69_07120, partial [Candidatus Sumerlaeota bacterium]|nr:hypothetical protein [Candidatus Sumerlaeota bacterium]
MQPVSQTENNINSILKHLQQYLDFRLEHAKRLNPRIAEVESDLKWHQMDSMRQVLRRSKPIGELRFVVADVLASFDIDKKRQLFSAKGQLAIMAEVITSLSDDLSKGGGVTIKDIATLYHAIDPSLKPVIELMQIWLWWDLPDAADLVLFENQVERFKMLLRSQVTEGLQAFYRNEMKLDKGGDLGRQQILEFEFFRTEALVQTIEKRRMEDGNHQQIIAREEGESADRNADGLVMQLAQHLRAAEMIAESKSIDASLREYYARALQCKPEDVKPERAYEFEQRFIAKAKKELVAAIQSERIDGTPYNFKLNQLAETKRMLEVLRNE